MITNNTTYYPKCHPASSCKVNPHHKLHFGEIKPDHLYINMNGFGRDEKWGNFVSKLAEDTAQKIKENENFDTVLKSISKTYREYLNKNRPKHNPYYKESNIALFGSRRYMDVPWITPIIENERKCKYAPYLTRFVDFVEGKNEKFKESSCNFICPERKTHIFQEKKIFLSEIIVKKLFKFSKGRTAYEAEICHPPISSIKPALNHISDIYNTLRSNKSQKSLDEINKQIGEIHWFFAQATPYYRGSAGIADILTKAIYESLDIQVSPWKKGIAPDLEAFVTDLEDYKNNYSNLFEKPPESMNIKPTSSFK